MARPLAILHSFSMTACSLSGQANALMKGRRSASKRYRLAPFSCASVSDVIWSEGCRRDFPKALLGRNGKALEAGARRVTSVIFFSFLRRFRDVEREQVMSLHTHLSRRNLLAGAAGTL